MPASGTLLSSGLGSVLWLRGLQLLPIGSVSLLSLASPLVASGVGWVALGERFNATQFIGAALIVTSMLVGQRSAPRPSKETHA